MKELSSYDMPFTPKKEMTVEERVERRFNENPSFRNLFKGVSYKFEDGTLTLHGILSSYYLKQILQFMLIDIKGVDRLENLVEVVKKDEKMI